MKKSYNFIFIGSMLLFFLISSGWSFQANESEYFYWYKGEKQSLTIDNNKRFIVLPEMMDRNELSVQLGIRANQIQEIRPFSPSATTLFHSKHDYQKEIYWTVLSDISEKMDLSSEDNITYQAPFFRTANNTEVGLSHLFYVKLNDSEDLNILEKFAKDNAVSIIGNNSFMPLWYILACDQDSKGNALEMANLFYESGFFNASQADLMEDNLADCVNDPLFGDQWYLSNTGQDGGTAGIDINVCDAWELSYGDEDIIVAILDHGLEMDHPDLPNISPISYDTETGTSPSVVLGPHGVAVAGIVGAAADNNQGISGVAPNVTLMSISNGLILSPSSSLKLADGINFAQDNGAHIINNSWAHDGLLDQVLDDAIDNALTFGRDGLGCVVVFSSGNNNSSTSNYPANSNPLILNVGAIDRCGIRSGRTDIISEAVPCDPWCVNCQPGSAYGSTLDLVAGGSTISTTDRQGSSGYNSGVEPNEYINLDYTRFFGGTSAAAPQVAGVAALVLSANPNLTVEAVNDILERTAQKIRPDIYNYINVTGRPNGTWNEKTGYGLVDAYSAIVESCMPNNVSISGPDNFCSSNTYSLTNIPPGAEITWSASPSGVVNISSHNSPQTALTKVGNSIITLTATFCGIPELSLSKQIAVGTLTIPTILDENGHETFGVTACLDDRRNLCMDIDPTWGVTETSWDIGMGNFNLTDQGACAEIFSFQPANGHILAKTRNACGWGGPAFISVNIVDCLASVHLYPNPATNNITLSVTPQDEILKGNKRKESDHYISAVNIRDHYGSVQLHRKYNEESAVTIDVSRLSEGMYVVEVDTGKRTEVLQLMIKK